MEKKLVLAGLLSALGEGVYVFLVALFMFNSTKIAGNEPGIVGIVSVLLIFVISAALSGAIVLGKPILLYLEGKKSEAIKLFGMTIGWMLVLLVILLIVMSMAK